MYGGRLARAAVFGTAIALPLLGVVPGASATRINPVISVAPTDVRTVTYDASGAPSWQTNVDAAVKIWNDSESTVFHLQPASGGQADFTIAEGAGWPETQMGGTPGTGSITLGQQAADQGYDKTRITAHEMGHVFGLPDDYNGPCSEIMSGHGPGVSCTNAQPDAKEIAQVAQNFQGGGLRNYHPHTVIDIPPAVESRQLAHR